MADDDKPPHDEDGHLRLPTREELQKLRESDTLRPVGLDVLTRNHERGRKLAKPRSQPRPQARVEDRRWVPPALKHWRRVHGISPTQAQARIGYSPKSNSWRKWEAGIDAPPYKTLLKIIAATGLGYWVDHERESEIDPTLRLEAQLAKQQDEIEEERRKLRGDG